MNAEVIIIGAGPAGLMAGYELCRQGLKVTILEARDRIGGRAFTMQGDQGISMEAGAEFVHGSLPITLSLLKEAGLTYTTTGGEWVVVQSGDVTENLGTRDWPLLMKKLKSLKEDMSLQDFLEQYFPEDEYAMLKDRAISYAEGYDSADASRVSAMALHAEWSKREEDEYRIDKGYSALMDYLASKCVSAGAILHLSQPVSTIVLNEGSVSVLTGANTFTAAKVIVALPLGILQDEGAINFQPANAAYNKAVQSLGIGDVVKFLFLFRETFWEDSYPGVGFLLGRAEIPTWWTQAPANSPLLTGWIGGRGARAHAHLSNEQLVAAGLDSLAQLFSKERETIEALLVDARVINWSNDPYARGSYAYTTVGANAAQKVLQDPMDGRIFFAGEYMFNGPEMGTVEAALWSGQRVAAILLKQYGEGK